MRYVIRPVRGNEAQFNELKSIAAEFGRVALVNEKRHSIALDDVTDRPALASKVEAAGGRVFDDVSHVSPTYFP